MVIGRRSSMNARRSGGRRHGPALGDGATPPPETSNRNGRSTQMMADRQDTLTVPPAWEATVEVAVTGEPEAATAAPAAPAVGAPRGGWLELVFLLGLGSVFLVNAAVALVEPAGFIELVAASPMGAVMGDGAWIAPLIAVNDLLIGSAVIAAHRFPILRAPVLAWAGVWLLIVTVLKITTMG
jgi:hypothetical protein